MIACIIAAGEGSRLLQEGCKVSKPLVKINGTPMIERLLRILDEHSFDEINIIINEYSQDVSLFLENIKNSLKAKLTIIRKTTPSSMHSLYELSKSVKEDRFHLFTVDSIFYLNEFKDYLNFCSTNKGQYDAIMAVTRFIDDEKPLFVEIKNGKITHFLDKTDTPEMITSGFYYFNKNIHQILQEQIESGSQKLRNFLRQLTACSFKIGYFEFSKTIDVDHIEDIAKAQMFINEV